MGASISSEQFEAHLNRQQDLINRLDAVVQRSAERLQAAGSFAIDYSVDGDGHPEDENDDARSLIANLYKKSREVNSLPSAEGPLNEDELSQLTTKPDAVETYNPDALTFKPWLKSLVEPTTSSSSSSSSVTVDGSAPFTNDRITLSRAIGFSGSMLRCAAWMDAHTVVYAVGGVAVIQDTRSKEQTFFREHSSAISTIAVHPGRRVVATAQLGFLPVIHIWNVDTLERINTIADVFRTGLTSIKFSADGSQLAAVDYSDDHLLGVYNWETGRLIASAQHHSDVFDLCFVSGDHISRDDSSEQRNDPRIVTVGDGTITFWSTGDDDEKLRASPALLGNAGKKQPFTAVCVSGEHVIVGTQNGELYLFQRQKLLRVLDVQTRMITCLVGTRNSRVVYCAGYDGVVSAWSMESFKKVFTHNSFYANDTTAPILSLDVIMIGSGNESGSKNGVSDQVLVGNTKNMLTILSASTNGSTTSTQHSHGQGKLVLQGGNGGHVGDQISSFAVHPSKKRIATGGADYQVVEWDIEQLLSTSSSETSNCTGILRTHRIPAHATCCTYAPSNTSSVLAVGLSNGTICIFNGDELTSSFSLGKRRVQCCTFSSNGRLLAAGTADNVVEVFEVGAGDAPTFTHICQLPSANSGSSPLSGVVINIDFASNDNILRVATQSYELVYFDINKRQRIEDVASLSSILFATHTSLFGWEVQGIWRLDSEFNDVNAVCRSHNKKYLATGETTGVVKLFRYPCVGGGLDENGVLQRRPDSNRLKGHVSNVLGVEWFGGDQFIATASPDCILVWKL